MSFTLEDLELIVDALDLADDEIYNRIITCPDAEAFAEQLEALKERRRKIHKLGQRFTIELGKRLPKKVTVVEKNNEQQ